jgi:hypothetical protein
MRFAPNKPRYSHWFGEISVSRSNAADVAKVAQYSVAWTR